MGIEVRGITKRFGAFVALRDVSLGVGTGEMVALLGPSGSGKTTLLRIIAGLEFPDSGTVWFDDAEATERTARDRHVGFVFQHYSLFRHMSVFENIAFGLRVRPRRWRQSETEIHAKVRDLLHLVQLDGLAGRRPAELSGGQRQRVALARALAVDPAVLLLDEPFGSLDARVRKELRRWLRRLHDDLHVTSVFVTHDQEEAMEVADRVAILRGGELHQLGTPEEIYFRPASPFVSEFVGSVNLFRGRLQGGRPYVGAIPVEVPSIAHAGDGSALIYVRPHDFVVDRNPGDGLQFRAAVARVKQVGPYVKLDVVTDSGDELQVDLDRRRFEELGVRPGMWVFLRPQRAHIFSTDSTHADATA